MHSQDIKTCHVICIKYHMKQFWPLHAWCFSSRECSCSSSDGDIAGARLCKLYGSALVQHEGKNTNENLQLPCGTIKSHHSEIPSSRNTPKNVLDHCIHSKYCYCLQWESERMHKNYSSRHKARYHGHCQKVHQWNKSIYPEWRVRHLHWHDISSRQASQKKIQKNLKDKKKCIC